MHKYIASVIMTITHTDLFSSDDRIFVVKKYMCIFHAHWQVFFVLFFKLNLIFQQNRYDYYHNGTFLVAHGNHFRSVCVQN